MDKGIADGFAFVIQNHGPKSISREPGSSLGYNGIPHGVVAIEFDNWKNTPYNDPVYDHVSIQIPDTNGFLSCEHSTNSLGLFKSNFKNGNINNCKIVYNRKDSEISIFLTINNDNDLPLIEKIENCKIPFDFPLCGYMGFTGSCGDLFQTTTIYTCSIKAKVDTLEGIQMDLDSLEI
ncbi:hypothetical protein DICPUDRAFT_147075 [Dictyostelium purpureum]|uniref:Legume lectin domain-containing protein n=1 Tax=Dictyostelium purpureum TaxID=5786 RepID=F0Z7L4_DICPU|nr:uncharacterized protein DICPUDRAFT_147075 [Dictyostelium purpureum]EGC40038.1 hypothetical protein DICPUDRAFT_147075 [Dictyostelium purpureum]|eukprot:XP_003283387.1 hypothetical protein DICPUDRAFT_147075 [Dictyostelium purpureum]